MHPTLLKENIMKEQKQSGPWVVYKMHFAGETGPNAVCEQSDWDLMEASSPGYNKLLREGIANEGEAERVARELPGGTAERPASLRGRLR
jgi:hypothetical protein